MFPLRDENPTVRRPVATVALIAVNVLVWILVQGVGSEPTLSASVCQWGLMPAELLGQIKPGTVVDLGRVRCELGTGVAGLNVVSSMFMHGGWFHILSNMWFLWVFGDNVEDAMGPARFVAFYVLCGVGAALAQVLSGPASVVPMVGASGAIGGVMGAYARLYPRARVHMLVFFGFIFTVSVPAIVVLGYWFLLQLLEGTMSLGATAGGVAFWAHIGGFIAGLALIGPMHKKEFVRQHATQQARQTARYRWG
ncbi:MAG: rhomboid family intramembrane serine protease [Gemmatimonadales bacterium]